MVSMKMQVLTAALGLVSFILGVLAENKKPLAGTPITAKGFVICTYPKNPTVLLGILSVIFLFASSAAGCFAILKDTRGKVRAALFESTIFKCFFGLALGMAGFAAVMLIWPTATEQMHLSRNKHHNLETTCPTAKTGLLGGGGFLALNSMLFFLLAFMFSDNAQKDYARDSLPERTNDLEMTS